MRSELSSARTGRPFTRHGGTHSESSHLDMRSTAGRLTDCRADPVGHTIGPWASSRVLVVDRDATSREGLTRALQRHGHEVITPEAGRGLLDQCADSDLLILNLESLDVDGVELCRDIAAAFELPIIATAELGCTVDCVLALQAGADDYVVKPYRFPELMARVDSLMWRVAQAGESEAHPVVTNGPLHIDVHAREVLLLGRLVALTRKEFDLLVLLAEHTGEVVPRAMIMQTIWNDSWSRRTIDTHVSSLRAKLGSSDWIVVVRGVGFKLVRASEVASLPRHIEGFPA